MESAKNVLNKKKSNNELSRDLQRSGYDRCRRGFISVLSILNEQRGNEQGNAIEELKIENKGQSETLENMEGMVIKLIDRWNKSDEKLDRKFDDLTKEVNDLDNQVSEIKGIISRLNGKH